MFARQLDTGFAGEVRGLVTDPATGLAGKDPEEALAGIAETTRLLGALKDRYLAQAIGPRQKAMLEPVIDRRLDRAGGDLGRIAEQATSVLDDRSVAERLADLARDAALSWQDPAHLRTLGRTAVGELRYQGERKGWDASRTDTAVRTGLSDLYAGAVEAALAQDPERAAKLYDHARDVIQPERQPFCLDACHVRLRSTAHRGLEGAVAVACRIEEESGSEARTAPVSVCSLVLVISARWPRSMRRWAVTPRGQSSGRSVLNGCDEARGNSGDEAEGSAVSSPGASNVLKDISPVRSEPLSY